jgi:cytochrome c oxidase subunit 2
MKRFIIPISTTIVFSILLSILFLQLDMTPLLASQEGGGIDRLLDGLFILTAIIFSLVMSFLVYSLVAFRRKPGDQEDAKPVFGNVALEIVWTAIPLIIVLVLGAWGTRVLADISQESTPEDLIVEVTGLQWSWRFYYPDYGFTSAELVLPVNQPVLLRIRSDDVIHSFWIPEFRIKMDAVPGVVNEMRITPTEIGNYQVHCSELCGTAHAYMIAPSRVIEPIAFEEWASERQSAAEAGTGETGEQLTKQQGCLGCHSIDGSQLVGPTFKGLFGTTRTFQDGSTATADEEYLRNSILNPGAQVVQGYSNIMPDYYAVHLVEEQLEILVEYIKGLK